MRLRVLAAVMSTDVNRPQVDMTAPLRRIVGAIRHGRTRSETPGWIGDVERGAMSELLECGHTGAAVVDMFVPTWRARVDTAGVDPWAGKPDVRACWRCLTASDPAE